ncbi:hypothetical protein Leryth_021563 [Lithospermum erythrorhizon]|nr:hypothetical protein Leryth_021563 [Lithospermum erythrorhizon]
MTVDASSAVCNLSILEKLTDESIADMAVNWEGFSSAVVNILNGDGDGELSFGSDLVSYAQMLFEFGLESLVMDHFFTSIEEMFEKKGALIFWRHFEPYSDFEAIGLNEDTVREDEFQEVLCGALEGMSTEKEHEEKCLLMLVHALQSFRSISSENSLKSDAERVHLFSRYQLIVASVLMASLPKHFPDLLHWYFKGQLETLSSLMEGGGDDDDLPAEDMDIDERSKYSCRNSDMDIDECHPSGKISENNKLVKSIGMVVRNLRNVGFTSMAEDAYASAIFCLLKAKVHDLAGDDYRNSVLQSIKAWIQAVPMHFLQALLDYLGDSFCYDNISSDLRSPLASRPSSCCFGTEPPSEGLVRWQLRLEYFAYETLQDLRTEKLFDIIVDYPDSAPAIEDLKQCLDYTGQHSKLVDSFISSLRYRLLTAGASTNDILHQYVSTIKALRTIDPAGIFLEAVGEPIREYLRGRKDTIKCIVTMLTDGSGGSQNGPGSAGDSLLEELNRDEENQESSSFDDDVNTDDKQAWINAQNWEPDPVEADPLKGSRTRRKVDILGMIVGILGSKDQLVNEYRVMLAEKLLNKSDYDIDAEIRTLELLRFILERAACISVKLCSMTLLIQNEQIQTLKLP